MKKIAFTTYTNYPDLTPSDSLLAEAIRSFVDCVPAAWDDPTIGWENFDAVVIRSTWNYHLKPEAFLSWLDKLDRLNVSVFNDTATVRWNMDKNYLFKMKTLIVPSFHAQQQNINDCLDFLSSHNSQKAVLKPFISASANRTVLLDSVSRESLSEYLEDTPLLLQPYFPEVATEGEWSLMFFNGEFSHAVLKQPAGGDFRVQNDFGGTATIKPAPPQAIANAKQLLNELESLPLYARVDGIIRNNRFYLMELELIEPELFIGLIPESAAAFAAALKEKMEVR